MIRTTLGALWSHWGRHPLQLAMLLLGLALATGLWTGVQAINAEARAAYARAAGLLGQDRLDRIVAAEGALRVADFVALRRAGWAVSPLLEGEAGGLRVLGVEPLTLPRAAMMPGLPGPGAETLAGFLAGRVVLAAPETMARPGVAERLAGFELAPAPDLPPMTVLADIGAAERIMGRGERPEQGFLCGRRNPGNPQGAGSQWQCGAGLAQPGRTGPRLQRRN